MSKQNDWFFAINNPDGPNYLIEELREKAMSDEFQKSFEKSAAGIGRTTSNTGVRLSVLQLRGGDVCYHPMLGQYMFICRGPHPIWPTLQAIVWCSPRGELTIDALAPQQMLETPVVNRGETERQRAQRFREWYLENRK